jgi:hypothetical protein
MTANSGCAAGGSCRHHHSFSFTAELNPHPALNGEARSVQHPALLFAVGIGLGIELGGFGLGFILKLSPVVVGMEDGIEIAALGSDSANGIA